MPLGKESGIVPRVLDWLKILRWLRWEFPTFVNRFVLIIFFLFSNYRNFTQHFSPFQVFPMLEILAKELCSNGLVQISVGIRVDRSIYQVKCETKLTILTDDLKLFFLRWEAINQLQWPGRRWARKLMTLGRGCPGVRYLCLGIRWSGIRYLREVLDG